MSAYDDFLERLNPKKIEQYRRDLVSTRGNFSSGKLDEYMGMKFRARNSVQEGLDLEDGEADRISRLSKIYVQKPSGGEDFGFVFDMEGTQKAIEKISAGGIIKIFEDFKTNLLFKDEKKVSLWGNVGESKQKRLIAEDIHQMIKKTDVQYRTHGDRLHYFVIGKVVTKEVTRRSVERNVYPLFLFSCSETDQKRLTVEVEQGGFLNFWLDEKILGNEISKAIGGIEISIDQQLPSVLNNIQQRIKKLSITSVEELEFDPSFSMIGIVTGFETEYVDLAWRMILK